MLVDHAIHIHWPFKLRDEDEIYGFRPLFGINNRVLCLALFQVFQLRKNPIFHPDDSPTVRLRLTIVHPSSFPPAPSLLLNRPPPNNWRKSRLHSIWLACRTSLGSSRGGGTGQARRGAPWGGG